MVHLTFSRGLLPQLRWHRFPRCSLITVVIACAGIGCADPPTPEWPNWRDGRALKNILIVAEDDRTCTTCIDWKIATRVEIDSGPGMVDESNSVASDPNGRIWVGRSRGVIVYSARGEYLTTIGRAGAGAGEFRAPGPIFSDVQGYVRFFDQVLFRENKFDSSLRQIGSRELPLGPILDVEPLDETGEMLLVNAQFLDIDRVGYPVHLLEHGKLVKSFAMPQDSLFAATTDHLERRIAALGDGHFLISKVFDYELEVYSKNGDLVFRFALPGRWTPPIEGVPRPLSLDTELHGFIQDIQVDSAGRAWILSWEPRPDWRKNVEVRPAPDGTPLLMQKDDSSSLRRCRLDVIDLRTGALLATSLSESMVWGFVRLGGLYGYEYASQGEPRLVVYDVSLTGQR